MLPRRQHISIEPVTGDFGVSERIRRASDILNIFPLTS
jgi:hypothetical protein